MQKELSDLLAEGTDKTAEPTCWQYRDDAVVTDGTATLPDHEGAGLRSRVCNSCATRSM